MRRGDVDDAAASLRFFMPGTAPDRVEGGRKVDGDDRVPLLDGNSSIGATNWMPALLTSTSTPPNCSSAAATMSAIASALVMSAPE